MAFADSIRTTGATMSGVATLLESLLTAYAYNYDADTDSTTSTSQVNFDTVTEVSLTVPTGGVVLLLGYGSFSHGTQYGSATLGFARDSTDLSRYATGVAPRSSTAAGDFNVSLFAVDTPSAGTYTYKLRWQTGAGTAYTFYRAIFGAVLRIS